jgi:hypothetical protein
MEWNKSFCPPFAGIIRIRFRGYDLSLSLLRKYGVRHPIAILSGQIYIFFWFATLNIFPENGMMRIHMVQFSEKG